MSDSLTNLPEIDKTPTQRLIEARDPQKRDIRVIFQEAYAERRRLEDVAEEFTRLAGKTIRAGKAHEWAVKGWGWRFDRILVIPMEGPETEEVVTA